MTEVQIKYVNKTAAHHERITHLGNDQGTWKIDDVIRWIENREYAFFTREGGERADIAVRQGTQRKYLQTHADGYWKNNLLSLPACKVAAA